MSCLRSQGQQLLPLMTHPLPCPEIWTIAASHHLQSQKNMSLIIICMHVTKQHKADHHASRISHIINVFSIVMRIAACHSIPSATAATSPIRALCKSISGPAHILKLKKWLETASPNMVSAACHACRQGDLCTSIKQWEHHA